MKKLSKKLALATSLAMMSTFTACGGGEGADTGTTAAGASEPVVSVESATVTMASEDAEVVAQVEVDGEKLENPNLRWLSFWSLKPEESERVDVFLELFQTKYGGDIEWIQTTSETKYDDLATLVLGGNAPDLFPAADLDTFPGRVAAGMFQPFDDCVDFNSDLFPNGAKVVNELHTIGGKHYMACVDAYAGTIMIYNKKTIEENGLDDPAELAYNNEWTWSKLKEMCMEFADADNDKYAIDGWWFETAMIPSTGVPVIGMDNGKIVNNLMSPDLARVEEYFLDYYNNNLNFPRAEFNWTEHPERVGEGLTLFYPVGTWKLFEPNLDVFGDEGEIMFVPMPRDDSSDTWYQTAAGGLDAYAMCKGAPNPDAVKAFINCKLIANSDESVQAINDDYNRERGWTDEMIDMYHYASDLTNANPVVDFYSAVNNDVYNLIHNPIKDASYNGIDWYTTREERSDAVDIIIEEVNAKLSELE